MESSSSSKPNHWETESALDAFSVYVRFQERILRYLLNLGCRQFEVDEITADVGLSAVLEAYPKYNLTIAPLWPFLRSAIFRRYIDHCRSRNKFREIAASQLEGVEFEIFETEKENFQEYFTDRATLIRTIYGALDEIERLVLTLWASGQSYTSIAKVLCVSEGTVRYRIKLAIRKAKRVVEESGGDSG